MTRQITEGQFENLPFDTDPWRLVAQGSALALPQAASNFTIGNGFVGVRGPGDPIGAPRVYLNGVYEKVPIQYHEAAHGYARQSDTRLAVADATRPSVMLDGAPLPLPHRVTLDLVRGSLVQEIAADGSAITIETLAAMDRPGIVASRIRFAAELADRLTITPFVTPPPVAGSSDGEDAVYDPRIAPDLGGGLWHEVAVIEDEGVIGRIDRLPVSGFEVAALAACTAAADSAGDRVVECFAVYAASREGDALACAHRALGAARDSGFEALAAAQAAWFADHWKRCDFAMPAHPRAELAVRHALFQLVQAVGRDGRTSIAAKGQSGEGYEGHVFWDADLYALPVFALTRPEIARAMLVWRIAGLDAARANARLLGQSRGALYPWRTIGGDECSSFFPAGSAQYHINADIAFALDTYVQASGDRSILVEGGAEMLVETARIWLEIGFHDPARGAFVINRVTGPDEYSAIVDNNLYTNLMAQRHLRFAASEGLEMGLIDAEEAIAMRAAADAMLLPFDEERGIYLQDDGFFGKQPWPFATTPPEHYPLLLHYHPLTIYRHQVAKQADAVLALALMPDRFGAEVRRRMLDAYEAVTVHDSTLSASAFAIAAARAGDGKRARQYWQVAALTDLGNLFGNTDHGLHMAALAGSWSAISWGFAGLHIDGDVLCVDPVAVQGIDDYAFSISFRGSLIRIAIRDAKACFTLLEGAPVLVREGPCAPFLLEADHNADIPA